MMQKVCNGYGLVAIEARYGESRFVVQGISLL